MNELHELLARIAATPGRFAVTLSLHDVPTEVALQWLQEGLLDKIEAGAGADGAGHGNPPTGVFERELNDEPRRTVSAIVFTQRDKD